MAAILTHYTRCIKRRECMFCILMDVSVRRSTVWTTGFAHQQRFSYHDESGVASSTSHHGKHSNASLLRHYRTILNGNVLHLVHSCPKCICNAMIFDRGIQIDACMSSVNSQTDAFPVLFSCMINA